MTLESKMDYLKQVYRLDKIVKTKMNEVKELSELATSISSLDYTKEKVDVSKGDGAKFEDIIIKICDTEKEIKREVDILINLKKDIDRKIDTIKDVDERLLLRLRYINDYKWEDICEEMNISNSQIHRVHLRALKKLKI